MRYDVISYLKTFINGEKYGKKTKIVEIAFSPSFDFSGAVGNALPPWICDFKHCKSCMQSLTVGVSHLVRFFTVQ